MPAMYQTLLECPEDFQDLVSVEPDGCWFWGGPGGRDPLYMSDDGPRWATMFAWEHANGDLPDEHVLSRACNSRRCVNPHHFTLRPRDIRGRMATAAARKKAEVREHWAREAARLGLPPRTL